MVRYSLSPDGSEIVADEIYNGHPKSYHNQWVLVRKQADLFSILEQAAYFKNNDFYIDNENEKLYIMGTIDTTNFDKFLIDDSVG